MTSGGQEAEESEVDEKTSTTEATAEAAKATAEASKATMEAAGSTTESSTTTFVMVPIQPHFGSNREQSRI